MSESKFRQIEQISALQSPKVVSVMSDSLYLTQRMIDYAKYNATTNNFKFNIKFLQLLVHQQLPCYDFAQIINHDFVIFFINKF